MPEPHSTTLIQSGPGSRSPHAPRLRPLSRTWPVRLGGAVVAAAAGAVLGLAASVTPSEAGLGTHTQLRLPSCGWIAAADFPCMTCGMTTAFAHATEGNLFASFHAQPLGMVLALATAMAFLAGLYAVLTGVNLLGLYGRSLQGSGVRVWWAIGLAVLLAWGYKVVTYKGFI